jgi:hypothetical protein
MSGIACFTRGLALLFGIGTYLILRFPGTWRGFTWLLALIWDYTKHILVACFVTYLSFFLMMKLWIARPDAFNMAEAGINDFVNFLGQKFTDGLALGAEFFAYKTLDAILNGFGVNTTHK